MKRKLKTAIIIIVVLALLAGIGGGAWYWFGTKNADPVYVYSFDMVGMTEYWGDTKESYGPVSTDSIQTVYLSTTQSVTEILVSEGDQVQKGDLLMTFDTTLSDLAVEKARLEVEKLKLQLIDDQNRLAQIKSMRPMVIPSFEVNEEEDLGAELTDNWQRPLNEEYDGSSKEQAMVCWILLDTEIKPGLLEEIRQLANDYQYQNALAKFAEEQATRETEEGEPEPTPPQPEDFNIRSYYVIFKQTVGNKTFGTPVTWQGMWVNVDTGILKFFDATGNVDYTLQEEERPQRPEIDFGSGYTAAQIAEMRREQEKKIQDTEFQIKMAETNYKIMLTEKQDGNVYAEFDGKVVSVLDEEEAKLQSLPVLKVSGGGGFRIQASIGELEKDQLEIGSEVSVMDYRFGGFYTGTVQSIGDYPSNNGGYWGNGNPNSSYYPFTVFVDESADLMAGNYVNIQFSLGETSAGIYLENPYLRKDNTGTYVMVAGEDGRLEQRYVTTGKALWGSYTEVLDGLTPEDKLAFPYGKNVKPGVPTQDGDYSTMYGY